MDTNEGKTIDTNEVEMNSEALDRIYEEIGLTILDGWLSTPGEI
jgi:hypothetical protein